MEGTLQKGSDRLRDTEYHQQNVKTETDSVTGSEHAEFESSSATGPSEICRRQKKSQLPVATFVRGMETKICAY